MATMIVDAELTATTDVDVPPPWQRVFALARWCGRPVGPVSLVPRDGRVTRAALWAAVEERHADRLASAIVETRLGLAAPDARPLPSATVAVCTRDRPQVLGACLERLIAVRPNGVDVLVVDNAPSDERTARLAADMALPYVRARRPGLSWARVEAAASARGEVLLFTDDDVVVDAGWVDALRRPFLDPEVAAVTGLVLPGELDTDAQELFEAIVGFSRGDTAAEFTAMTISPAAAGRVGAGASMAFRRALVTAHRLFATELGAGTVGRAGEETWAFYRLLALGHRIIYTPEAIAWHTHRREVPDLEAQVEGYAIGTMCVYLRGLLQHGDLTMLRQLDWWLREHLVRQLWRAWRGHPAARPPGLMRAELRGTLRAPWAYLRGRRRERRR